jgi:hypothetical protein
MIDFIDKHILVSGVRVKLKPYTERRMKMLAEIQREIDEFADKNPKMTFAEIDRSMVAKWWKAKADILWETNTPLDHKFFESEDFESSLLRDSEALFLANGQYL